MKFRVVAGLAAVAALGTASVADAAPSPYKVTGGGQTFATADAQAGVQGPGSTITFQSFIPATTADGGPGTPATGQVNIIDRRTSETGKGTHFRGTIKCAYLMPAGEGGYAELHGDGQDQDGTAHPFVVRIQDNGQGAAADADLVEFTFEDSNPGCSEEQNDDDFQMTLARGNAKIHKENSGASKSSANKPSAKKTATSKSLSTGSSLSKLVSLI